jgi:hypothetical protein
MKSTLKQLALAASLTLAAAGAHATTAGIASVHCTGGVVDCTRASDGAFPAEWDQWQLNTAWWSGLSEAVVFTLDGPTTLTSLTFSLDNNDDYRFDVSTDGVTWAPLITVAAWQGDVGSGMDTFSADPSSAYYDAALAFAPTLATHVRISAVGGDAWNSVGEMTLTSAVPEPTTALLVACGLIGVGLSRRRS